jgi:hypothetical protein
MEPEGSLPHSQEPATCPYPELCIDLVIINLEEKRLYGRPLCVWDNNTKTNLSSVEWNQMVKDTV